MSELISKNSSGGFATSQDRLPPLKKLTSQQQSKTDISVDLRHERNTNVILEKSYIEAVMDSEQQQARANKAIHE